MRERFLDIKRGLAIRLRHESVFISWQEWATIQSGIFDLNGADMINQNLAQNSVAAAYDYEGVTDATPDRLGFGRDALQKNKCRFG